MLRRPIRLLVALCSLSLAVAAVVVPASIIAQTSGQPGSDAGVARLERLASHLTQRNGRPHQSFRR